MDKTYTLKEILFEFNLKQEKINRLVIYCERYESANYYIGFIRDFIPPEFFVVNNSSIKIDFERCILISRYDIYLDGYEKFYETGNNSFIKG